MNEQAADKLGTALMGSAAIPIMGWLIGSRGYISDSVEVARSIGTGVRIILEQTRDVR